MRGRVSAQRPLRRRARKANTAHAWASATPALWPTSAPGRCPPHSGRAPPARDTASHDTNPQFGWPGANAPGRDSRSNVPHPQSPPPLPVHRHDGEPLHRLAAGPTLPPGSDPPSNCGDTRAVRFPWEYSAARSCTPCPGALLSTLPRAATPSRHPSRCRARRGPQQGNCIPKTDNDILCFERTGNLTRPGLGWRIESCMSVKPNYY